MALIAALLTFSSAAVADSQVPQQNKQTSSPLEQLRITAELASEDYNLAVLQLETARSEEVVAAERAETARLEAVKASADAVYAETIAAEAKERAELERAKTSKFVSAIYRDGSLAGMGLGWTLLQNSPERTASDAEPLARFLRSFELAVRQADEATAQAEAAAQNALAQATSAEVHLTALKDRLADAQAAAAAAMAAQKSAAATKRKAVAAVTRVLNAQGAAPTNEAELRIEDLGAKTPKSVKARVALATAQAQLGKPYIYAAAGPGAFDCSGLTMFAYAAAKVPMPHYSRAQYQLFPKVAVGDLQAGDLVFFGSPIHHVGLYVGNGQMIHAPHPGAMVRVGLLSEQDVYAGAVRPW